MDYTFSTTSTKTFSFGWRITEGLDLDSEDINITTQAYNASGAFPDLSSMTLDLDENTTN